MFPLLVNITVCLSVAYDFHWNEPCVLVFVLCWVFSTRMRASPRTYIDQWTWWKWHCAVPGLSVKKAWQFCAFGKSEPPCKRSCSPEGGFPWGNQLEYSPEEGEDLRLRGNEPNPLNWQEKGSHRRDPCRIRVPTQMSPASMARLWKIIK